MVGGKVALSDDCCCAPTPTGCPASITFSGIQFCCACAGVSGRVQFYEDVLLGVINGVTFPLTELACNDTSQVCVNETDLFLPERDTNTSDCPTGAESPGVVPLSIDVKLVSGVWYVAVGLVNVQLIVFYGSGANPSSIANDETDCTLSVATVDNPITRCFGTTLDVCVVGKNGTAALTF